MRILPTVFSDFDSIMSGSGEYIWQDRDIKFDVNNNLLSCRAGEVIIDSINSVEDTKGNNGERGSLIVTNLRLMWISHSNNRINLSKGGIFLLLLISFRYRL